MPDTFPQLSPHAWSEPYGLAQTKHRRWLYEGSRTTSACNNRRCALDYYRGNLGSARLGIERGDILAEQAVEIGPPLACLLVEQRKDLVGSARRRVV